MQQSGKTDAAALPEVRNNGTAIQWRYPLKKNGATLWRLPSCEVLPEKTARTEQTERTVSTEEMEQTEKTA